jgi:hypothetical protein
MLSNLDTGSKNRRDGDHMTAFGWFMVNVGPFLVVAFGLLAIFDGANAGKWAAAAAVIAGFTGGSKPTPALNGGIKAPHPKEPPQ